MSQEKILRTLESLGLSPYDAQVYLFLGKRGPQKTKDISQALKMSKQHLYLILKNLQSKGVVQATLERPAKFSAIPFERVLDLFIKAKMEDAQRIKHDKPKILSDWQSIAIAETADQPPKFAVIEGRNFIYPRLRQMIEETKSHLSVISTFESLTLAEQQGLLVAAYNQASRSKVNLRLLIELTNENLKHMKRLLKRISKISPNFEIKSPELGLKPISRMIIRDDTEIAFFLNQDEETSMKAADEVCLWTNSKTIVNSFKAVFEDLWKSSIDQEKRIAEIETGKPIARTYVINDPIVAKEKLQEILSKARSEIKILTSARGLNEAWKEINQLRDKVRSGISIQIMAPVTRDNFEAAQQLVVCCEVRHVSTSYLRTIIVDGTHLFQSRNAPSDRENDALLSFENSFYTTDLEYVNRTKNLVDDIWKNAYKPSTITLEEIVNPQRLLAPPVSEEESVISRKDSPYQKTALGVQEKQGVITEQEILNRIMTVKRTFVRNPAKDVVRIYGCEAMCAIHPPKSFNLPDMMISAWHCSKQSSFGAEDWFQVYLWLETSEGSSLRARSCLRG